MRGRFPRIEDEELVLMALVGHLEAFDELARRFRGAVVLVAEQALGQRQALVSAEDLAQEAILLAFKALPQLTDPKKFAPWLCAITRRRAWRIAHRERRQETMELSKLDQLLLTESPTLGGAPEQECLRREEKAALYAGLAALPEEHRLALSLYYFEEWNVARIADFLSLPSTTVKWRLHQGRKLLCRQLTDEQGIFSPHKEMERADTEEQRGVSGR